MAIADLRAILKDGPKESKLIVQEMIERGYSESLVHKVRKRIGIEGGGRGRSSPWELA